MNVHNEWRTIKFLVHINIKTHNEVVGQILTGKYIYKLHPFLTFKNSNLKTETSFVV